MGSGTARASQARTARVRRAVALAASVTLGLLACAAWAGGLPVPTQTAKKLPPGVIHANPGLRAYTESHSFDFASGIGLVEGGHRDSLWVVIADTSLAVGDSLTLISDEPNPDADTYVTIIGAAVKERSPSQRYPAIWLGKTTPVAESGDLFYRLEAPPGALDCCIFGYAVRAPRSAFHRVSGHAESDLDLDGTPEIFQSCGSGDYLYPSVWSGNAITGKRLWSRAYHLDYPVESECPGGHDSLSTK